MLNFIKNNRESTVLIAILILFLAISFADSSYFHIQTLTMVFSSAQVMILLAIGSSMVMLTRNIDVSIGSTMGLSAVAVATALNAGFPLPIAALMALCVGAACGCLNGVLVAIAKIPAIVATLGTLGLFRGLMLLWTGGKWIEGLPNSIKALSSSSILGISYFGWFIVVITLAFAYMLTKTQFGRNFYAVGDNLQGARQLGVSVDKTRIIAFTLNGTMAAMAGIVFTSQIGFVPNTTGNGLEMKAIAACVLGGISLLGGVGTVIGAVLGAFFLTQIDSVLVLLRLPAWWNDFIAGLVLLSVLVFDGRLRVSIEKAIKAQRYARFRQPASEDKPSEKRSNIPSDVDGEHSL
ncbi:autoinducer 2 ABC transporter permease LsrC [Vibrio panuliri]|uniref:Autoinducer 2 import system permease protein LsrC n=1 Tax=Vibrio panuliri TaxID=1381081 RepID=A0ABX3FFB6_9VIBR|nr:autoinducer 2 ABC transporter permease LsrC [Vibrio panuliri]KAB1454240.1 autoinducer 2 ABC transporter permease LsrC [Vibrio panuliri]OLQ88932.1 autoinducer 2 ABC transporter permease LsrC [Vibrio panuliri]